MKELEDYEWFPHMFRQFQTDYIGYVVSRFDMYNLFISMINSGTLTSAVMFDLCSGSGEPAISIFRRSIAFDSLILSDKFPPLRTTNEPGVTYMHTPVDVCEMEFGSRYTYTMFNAFHHFDDEAKKRIVSGMTGSGAKAFIVEILEPGLLCVFKVFFATTIGTLLLTPFIRPFSLKRLVFTYFLPVNIITITYDGLVSVCKSRSEKRYKKLFEKFGDNVRISRNTNGFSPLTIIEIN